MSHFAYDKMFGKGHFSGRRLTLPIDSSLIVEDWMSDLGITEGPGGGVGSWTGQIQGVTLTAAAEANEPALIPKATSTGRPVVRFDGVANYLEAAAFDLSSSDAYDWWYILKRNVAATPQDIVVFNGTVNCRIRNAPIGNVRIQHVANVGTNIWQDSSAILDTLRVHYNQTDMSLSGDNELLAFVDSTLTSYSGHLTMNDNTDANLGSGTITFGSDSGGSNFASCDIARVIITQPGTDNAAIAQFISDLYGVP